MFTKNLIFILLFIGLAKNAFADANENYVEVEYAHSALTQSEAPPLDAKSASDWNDVNVLNYFGWGEHRFVIETDYKNHFGEKAGVLGLTYTQPYDAFWYQDFSTSVSTNNLIVPGWVVFTEIHRKLLADQSLVAGLGIGHNVSRDPYSDNYGLFELTYYFQNGVSLQAGARTNISSPGSVTTYRGFGSINVVSGVWELLARFESGREGYTAISDTNIRNEFGSREESVQARLWLHTGLGVGARLNFYQSFYYNRNEVALNLLYRY